MPDQTNYPRITLQCLCGNEFNVNVMRMKNREPVLCQVCGQVFSEELGEKFAQAFEDLYKVKYQIDKDGNPFKYAFVYKSTFNQPPSPFPVGKEEEDKASEKD
ncbi:MAG: hypothetical protein AB1782_19230 [Cyanobacteriota bacterium]